VTKVLAGMTVGHVAYHASGQEGCHEVVVPRINAAVERAR
jgi:hypothetical protein